MEVFKEKCLAKLEEIGAMKNSKAFSQARYVSTVEHLKGNMELSRTTKFSIKKKGFGLINIPEHNLTDVLVVPKEKGDDGCEASQYLTVVSMDKMFEVVDQLHCSAEQQHAGYRKLEDQIRNMYYGIPRSYVRFHCGQCPVCQLAASQVVRPPLKPIVEKGSLSRIQIDLVDLNQVPDASASTTWTHDGILLLLETFREHMHMFNSESYKKLEVWSSITSEMNEKGYGCTREACDKKWRQLKFRYKAIVAGNKAGGKDKRKWQYFEFMNDILAADPSEPAQMRTMSSIPEASNTTWTHEGILLLVETFRHHAPMFHSPSFKRTEIWIKIASDMNANGYQYTSETCDKKWRQLKFRYKTIVAGKKTVRSHRRKWRYFDLMNDILAGDPSVLSTKSCPPGAVNPSTRGLTGPASAGRASGAPSPPPAAASTTPTSPGHSTGLPAWLQPFLDGLKPFVEEQRRHHQEMRDLQLETINIARERNDILRQFTTAMLQQSK